MTPSATPRGRRGTRGQVMLVFALIGVLLLAIAGLAVDAGISYFSSDQVERAAAAAALAGVAYLPGDYPDAANTALVEAARNGFTDGGTFSATTGTTACPTNPSGSPKPCVLVSQPATNELTVTITVSVPVTFLKLIGFGPHPVTRSATAEYLPPIALGEPGAQQGSDMEGSCSGLPPSGTYCTSPASGLGSGGSNFYFEREEGWGNPRSEGDPFTPTPQDLAVACGPTNVSCVASPSDLHSLSPWDGSEPYYPSTYPHLELEYTGGSNYLISVPPGQSVDVQVYNPSFAPDSNDQNGGYSYHEDDSSLNNLSTTATDYSAMSYTIFSVPTLSSDQLDTPISQEVFYPYNATCLYLAGTSSSCASSMMAGKEGYYYFPTGTGTATAVDTATAPDTYHQWVSALDYSPTGGAGGPNGKLFSSTMSYGSGVLSNPSTATSDKYFRLEVDSLQWNGTAFCTSSSCTVPNTGTGTTTQSNGQSKAHKGYAVRLAVPGSSSAGGTGGTVCSSSTAACSTATISAMDDMTVYTPVVGTSFGIPLFQLDPAYAGQTIDVDIFDIGDVGGGDAYVGIQQPDGAWATATSMADLGDSLGAGGSAAVAQNWNGSTTTCTACFQTASGGGQAIYNGQWVQLQIAVPSSMSTWGYWQLEYSVAAGATAGDTFAVQVGFNGTPDRLLP